MMKTLCPDPTVSVPPWDAILEDPTADVQSPFSVSCLNDDNAVLFEELATQQHRYLHLHAETAEYDDVNEVEEEYDNVHMDAFTCDHFRMYEFKVRRCARGRSHDWTECPYAHPGEKARRRDPRKFHYSGNPCPEFRKGSCKKGDTCEFAHGVFECWLHPSRYRTQPCKDGVQCRRRICFFAHTPEQLRILPPSHHVSSHPDSYDGSPSRFATDSHLGKGSFGSSPTSTLYFPHCSTSAESPPMSPVASLGPNPVGELASTIRNLQIGKSIRLSMNGSWSGYCPPLIPYTLRPGFSSLPSTPTRPGLKVFDLWDQGCTTEESVMARVESGKELRAQIYAKLSRENALTVRVDSSDV